MKSWLLYLGIFIVSLLFIFFVGTKPNPKEGETEISCNTVPGEVTNRAILDTGFGKIEVDLYGKETPKTVENFVKLARDNFYKNLKFHRIIKDFMVQTGDPKGDGTGGPGYTFEDEPVTRCYKRGTVAMANSGPNTNGSQFFIMHQDKDDLPKLYTIFGTINASDSASFAVLDKIAETPVATNSAGGEMSQPIEEVLLKSVSLEPVTKPSF